MGNDMVLVPLLPGFEEIEAVTIVDVLRRADIPVVIASEKQGPVEGAHGISVLASHAFDEVDVSELSMIALPGGMPGAKHLAEHADVQRIIKQVAERGGYTSAICAAPMALAAADVHRNHHVTSYPGFEKYLEGASYVHERVVVDDRMVTSQGPGTALDFALTLVGLLRSPEVEADLAQKMLVSR